MDTPGSSPLGIYLNDHLGGATAGVELVRRLAGATRAEPAHSTLVALAGEITADREVLLTMMTEFDVAVRQYKVALAWVAERLGRLKPNGHLLTRSPLSSLIELEMLRLGIEGKAAGWRTLRVAAAARGRDDLAEQLDDLEDRARDQAQRVENLRMQAASDVLGTPVR